MPASTKGRAHYDIKPQNIRVLLGLDGEVLQCGLHDLGASVMWGEISVCSLELGCLNSTAVDLGRGLISQSAEPEHSSRTDNYDAVLTCASLGNVPGRMQQLSWHVKSSEKAYLAGALTDAPAHIALFKDCTCQEICCIEQGMPLLLWLVW